MYQSQLAINIFHLLGSSPTLLAISLPGGSAAWVAVAFVAVMAVMVVAAAIYVLSGFIGSPTARGWSRAQIYEALLSLALLLIFVSLWGVFSINPANAYSSLGILPKNCSGQAGTAPSAVNTNSANTLFSLADCDLSYFNQRATSAYSSMFWASFIFGLAPQLSASATVPLAVTSIQVSTSIQIIPPIAERILQNFVVVMLIAFIINQLQVILLSSSILFLSFFLIIGLVARIFGFSRRFGGLMIALGLALGFIYPLLVSLTYGYIDVQVQSLPLSGVSGVFAMAFGIINAGLGILTSMLTNTYVASPFLSNNTLILTGNLILGFTVVPIINFLILDAFLIDFSSAVGERMDFFTLMSGLL
jgi:hypothetical protein